jgi:hypothetical protein
LNRLLYSFVISFFVYSCGLTDPKFESRDQTSNSTSSNAVNGVDCGKLTGEDCFSALIQPKVEENCVGCHNAGVIGDVKYQASDMSTFREALLSFTGDSEKKLDDKIRKGPHVGGVHKQPSLDNINNWLASEGVVKRIESETEDDDTAPGGGDSDGDGDTGGGEDDPTEEMSCGVDGMACFVALIKDDFEDNCLSCHPGTPIGGMAITPNNVASYRNALLAFVETDVNKLDNKLRQNGVTHGGGNQTNPTQVKILEWLKKEGIE